MTTDDDRPQDTFTFGPYVWDVTAAAALAPGALRAQVELRGLFVLLRFVAVDLEHAATVDLTEPLLLVRVEELGGEPVLIDGWHRVARARTEGLSSLPGRLLTEEQEFGVRLHGGRRGLPPRRGRVRRSG